MATNITPCLTDQQTAVVGKALVETLCGNLTAETVKELRELPIEIENVPQPMKDLIKQIGGSASTGKDLTLIVLDELHGACEKLLETL